MSHDLRLADATRIAHDVADAAGLDGYVDPVTGLFVMTAGYLARRGECCGKSCRHCPYDSTPRLG